MSHKIYQNVELIRYTPASGLIRYLQKTASNRSLVVIPEPENFTFWANHPIGKSLALVDQLPAEITDIECIYILDDEEALIALLQQSYPGRIVFVEFDRLPLRQPEQFKQYQLLDESNAWRQMREGM